MAERFHVWLRKLVFWMRFEADERAAIKEFCGGMNKIHAENSTMKYYREKKLRVVNDEL